MDLLRELENMDKADLIKYMEENFSDSFDPGYVREMLSGERAEEFRELLMTSLQSAFAAPQEEEDKEDNDQDTKCVKTVKEEECKSDDSSSTVNVKTAPAQKKKRKRVNITPSSSSSSSSSSAVKKSSSYSRVIQHKKSSNSKKKIKTKVKGDDVKKPAKKKPVIETIKKEKNIPEISLISSSSSSSSSSFELYHKKKDAVPNPGVLKKEESKTKNNNNHEKKEVSTHNDNDKKVVQSKNDEYYRKKFNLKPCKVILFDIKKQKDCHWREGDKVYRESKKKQERHVKFHHKEESKSRHRHHHSSRDHHNHRRQDKSSSSLKKKRTTDKKKSDHDKKKIKEEPTPYQHLEKQLLDFEAARKQKKFRDIMNKVNADLQKRQEEEKNKQSGIPRILSLIPLPLSTVPTAAAKKATKEKKLNAESPVVPPSPITNNHIYNHVKTTPTTTMDNRAINIGQHKVEKEERIIHQNSHLTSVYIGDDDDDVEIVHEKKNLVPNVRNDPPNTRQEYDYNNVNHNKNINKSFPPKPPPPPQIQQQRQQKQQPVSAHPVDNVDEEEEATSSFCRLQMERLEEIVEGIKEKVGDDEEDDSVARLVSKIDSWFSTNEKEPYFQVGPSTPENDEEDMFLMTFHDLYAEDFEGGSSDPDKNAYSHYLEDQLDSVSNCSGDEFIVEEEYVGACLLDLKSKIRIGGTGRETVVGENKFKELVVSDPNCFKPIFTTVRGKSGYDHEAFVAHCSICKGDDPDAAEVAVQGALELREHIYSYKHRNSLLQASLKLIKLPRNGLPIMPHPNKVHPNVIESEKANMESAGQWTTALQARWNLKESDILELKKFHQRRRIRYVFQKPEDHPSYSEEWNKFWERRHSEIEEQECPLVADLFDYNTEWTEEWKKISEPLLVNEYLSKRNDIIVKYAMDSDSLLDPSIVPNPHNFSHYTDPPQARPFYIDPCEDEPEPLEEIPSRKRGDDRAPARGGGRGRGHENRHGHGETRDNSRQYNSNQAFHGSRNNNNNNNRPSFRGNKFRPNPAAPRYDPNRWRRPDRPKSPPPPDTLRDGNKSGNQQQQQQREKEEERRRQQWKEKQQEIDRQRQRERERQRHQQSLPPPKNRKRQRRQERRASEQKVKEQELARRQAEQQKREILLEQQAREIRQQQEKLLQQQLSLQQQMQLGQQQQQLPFSGAGFQQFDNANNVLLVSPQQIATTNPFSNNFQFGLPAQPPQNVSPSPWQFNGFY